MQLDKTLQLVVFLCTLVQTITLFAGLALAESYLDIQKRRPELFHPETGLRVDRHRAPTPENIPPPSVFVGVEHVAKLLNENALPVDVFGALQSRYDELAGTWLVRGPRMSLPGAVWLPETGRGVLTTEMLDYLRSNINRRTKGDHRHPIIVFCVADCWMSWNAAQRISSFGYTNVYWFRHGTDDWLDSGRKLAPVLPVPVDVE